MIFSKTAISLLCLLLLLSIFVAHILNIIATDHTFYEENENDRDNFTKYLSKKYGRITDTHQNIIWFLQVSIYVFLFAKFCYFVIASIKVE